MDDRQRYYKHMNFYPHSPLTRLSPQDPMYSPYNYPPPGPQVYSPMPNEYQGSVFDPSSIPSNLLAQTAMAYGSKLIDTGKGMVDERLSKYKSVNLLRHYFSVDTAYVGTKLRLILFPFFHSDWSRKFEDSSPATPRKDVNSPDLYIPLMAYVTYLLVIGLVLGARDQFNVENLVMLASQSIGWICLETGIQIITLYITSIQTNLNSIELVAFSGYKFIGVIISVLLSLVFYKKGYYAGLLYCGIALSFFMVRTLKLQILSNSSVNTGYSTQPIYGDRDPYIQNQSSSFMSKRQKYFLASMAISQPVFMWWLSYNLDYNLN